MRRRLGALVAVTLLAVTAGCGEPSIDDYCEQLRADREELAELVASGDAARLLGDLDLLRGLREVAPRDVRDEWDTFLGALEGLQTALDDAGVSAGDFDDGEAPEGLGEAERAGVVEAAERVQAADVVAAAAGIETQARDVCQVNLGL